MTASPLTIAALNDLSAEAFAAALAGIYAGAPWVAAAVAGWRPFADVAELHEALAATVMASSHDARLDLLRRAGGFDSPAGLPGMGENEARQLRDLNRRFHERFGFPFIIATHHRSRDEALAAFARRWETAAAVEEATALGELILIARERLDALVVPEAPGAGWLSLQVLDVAAGRPAAGVQVVLSRVADTGRRHRLLEAVTNVEGRTDHPLLAGGGLVAGRYSLDVGVAGYFRAQGLALPDPPFLEVATLGFGVADAGLHCHLLAQITPYGFNFSRSG